MKGIRPGNLPTPNRAEVAGRVCDEPGCQTTLSIYNRSSHCWQHTDIVFPNHRGKRLTPRPSS
jgi:hypothetical protein